MSIYLSDRDKWTPSRRLFQQLKRALGDTYPISIFMSSCHGGAAAEAAMKELPRKAVFVALSDSSEVTKISDIDRLAGSIDSISWSSVEQMLYHYLVHLRSNESTPVIAYTSVRSFTLQDLVSNRKPNQPFSEKERERIHRRIDPLMGKKKVDALIEKISNEGVHSHTNKDYGPILAILFATREEYYSLHNRIDILQKHVFCDSNLECTYLEPCP